MFTIASLASNTVRLLFGPIYLRAIVCYSEYYEATSQQAETISSSHTLLIYRHAFCVTNTKRNALKQCFSNGFNCVSSYYLKSI